MITVIATTLAVLKLSWHSSRRWGTSNGKSSAHPCNL